MIVPVILAGGAGTRLWPLSRQLHPKQVLPITGQATMIQETLGRLEGLDGLAPPIVICNESHRFMIAEQMRERGIVPGAIILEPMGKNTAPAVAVAALHAALSGMATTVVVAPDRDRSGASNSLTLEQPIRARTVITSIVPATPLAATAKSRDFMIPMSGSVYRGMR
mgnify:CR=1 FL=1